MWREMRSYAMALLLLIMMLFTWPQKSAAQYGGCGEPDWGWCVELQGYVRWWNPMWSDYEIGYVEGPFCCWAEEFEGIDIYFGLLFNPGQLFGVYAQWMQPPMAELVYLGPGPGGLAPAPMLAFGSVDFRVHPQPPVKRNRFNPLRYLASLLLPTPVAAQQPPPVCDYEQYLPGGGVVAYPCERPAPCGDIWDIIFHPIQYMDCRAYENSWEEYWYNFWLSLGVPWP